MEEAPLASAPAPGGAAADAADAAATQQGEEEQSEQQQQQQTQEQQQRAKAKKRTGTSKYDFVKVRVRLDTPLLLDSPGGGGGDGDGAPPTTAASASSSSSSYVLSRYLVARMLAVARVPYVKAVKCALELKKRLVDAGVAELSQRDLERRLFALLREKGFGADVVGSYRLAASFYGARVPLVVALAGAPWTGKTALAQQLAARLNAPNVVATDAVRAALGGAAWASAAASAAAAAAAAAAAGSSNNNGRRSTNTGGGTSTATTTTAKTPRAAAAAAAASAAAALAAACAGAGAGLAPVPLWARADLAPPAENEDDDGGGGHSRSSAAERRLCEAWRDECRAVRRALAGDLARALSDGRPLLLEGASLDPAALARDLGRAGVAVMLPAAAARATEGAERGSAERSGPGAAEPRGGGGAAAGAAGGGAREAAPLPRVRPAGGPRPIFIPVIVAMDEPDHRLMAQDALARREQQQLQQPGGAEAASEAAAFWRARALQAHLASYEREGLPVLRVRYGAFTEAVDALHDYALRCIQLSFRV